MEDKSRSTWTFLLIDKSQVPHILLEFITYVKTQFFVTPKTLRTDNGTEFVNKELSHALVHHGITHQKSCVYTPQQNGIVERKHRQLHNTARALRTHVGLPLHFWGDCLMTTTYLINRTPTPLL